MGSQSRHNGVLLSKWHPEESPLLSPLVTPLSTLPTHAAVIMQTCCLTQPLWAMQPTVWHIYSRHCTCTHVNTHTRALQWQGCPWLHQPGRLSCVTQVDGDETQFVCLCVVLYRCACVCEGVCDSVRADKGSTGRRAHMIHYQSERYGRGELFGDSNAVSKQQHFHFDCLLRFLNPGGSSEAHIWLCLLTV